MAAGVGLLPGIAQAAPAAPGGPGAAQPDLGPLEAGAPENESVRSSADRTVVTPLAGAGSRVAGAQGKLSAASPTVELGATATYPHQVALSVLATSEDAELDITVDWGDVTKTEGQGPARHGSKRWDFPHRYALGSYTIKVTVKDTTHGVQAVNEVKFTTAGTEFTPHAPTRLLDTRAGVGAKKAKVAGRSSVALKVAGAAQVPAGVRAVVLNVTVTSTTGPGHISVQSDKGLAETVQTSNVNYLAGQSVPNLVIANVGKDGFVHLFNGGWESVDLLADVTGYFTASEASGYTALNPTRVLDTRDVPGGGKIQGYDTLDVAIAGVGRVPKGATAVALNLTVTKPLQSGHLTAYPTGQEAPATSSVNFAAEQTVANSVIVPVGAEGKITLRNGSWMGTDVIIDVVGYYSADSQAAYVPASAPYRALDTRKDKWWGDKKSGPVPARSYLPVHLPPGEDLYPVVGWVLNATVTNTTEVGFLSVAADHNAWENYQHGNATAPPRPVSSALNWTAGATVPNLVQTTIGQGMIVDFWNQGWKSVDMIVDVQGKYQLG
ncbi:hypothetical protein M8Z33_00045 [Streptomyces sp. ZAF1911]|uniref:hypothetical protein n=1 Tax=Streptomyces sp. ZAF1911 TaxID=2944129 RepID=UPI00237B6475|nr:hypothetical protein [Streptomyces sp. ZAF1911]MDD9375092.1 hypothetical protein [Streptomyces sp. ZAF1911]